jgi:hypothetical protein
MKKYILQISRGAPGSAVGWYTTLRPEVAGSRSDMIIEFLQFTQSFQSQ